VTSITLSGSWGDHEPNATCLDLFAATNDNGAPLLLVAWEKIGSLNQIGARHGFYSLYKKY